MNNKKLNESTKTKYNKEEGPEEKKPKLYKKRSYDSFNICDVFKQKLHLQQNINRQQQITNQCFRHNC